MKTAVQLLIPSILATGLFAQSVRLTPAQSGEISRSISVTGEALEYVAPDEAVVRFGIETFDVSLDRSLAVNDASGGRVVRAIRRAGVEERGIQADHAEVEIVYPPDKGVAAGIAGYRVRRSYAVTLKDVRRLDKVMAAALRSGANHLEGYELATTSLRRHRDEARRRAIIAAREKAQALAHELGCEIGGPRAISEGYYGWYGTHGSWNSWRGWGSSQNGMSQNSSMAASDSGEPSSLSPLGQISVRAQVSVTFDLTSGPAR